jgi:hypothetical protein
MTDEITERGARDGSQLDLGRQHRFADRNKTSGISEEQLRAAARVIESEVSKVQGRLRKPDF